MRWWVALPLLSCPCAAWATPAARPLASGFDLSALAVRAPLTAGSLTAAMDDGHTDSRWLTETMGPPPGPAHTRAKLRIRGKKVKFRMPF
jgi:hypothetical protein